MKTSGRKLSEISDLGSTNLVTVSFKTTAIIKHLLIQESKETGITLSDHVGDIVTHYEQSKDIREKLTEKVQKFIVAISNGENDKIMKYFEIWKKL